ncbi:uncharacterized protein CCOS01_00961, partial [Colletotrichum costaricense]
CLSLSVRVSFTHHQPRTDSCITVITQGGREGAKRSGCDDAKVGSPNSPSASPACKVHHSPPNQTPASRARIAPRGKRKREMTAGCSVTLAGLA